MTTQLTHTALRPYQQRAFRKGRSRQSFALFMEPGTGKTLTTLAILAHHWNKGRIDSVLIVGPLVSEQVWREQAREHLAIPHTFHEGLDGKLRKGGLNIYFVNPEKLWRSAWIELRSYDAVVVDESQSLKGRKSRISKAMANFKTKFRYILTGTPMDKDYVDLWAQWRFAHPELFGTNWRDFVKRWCDEKPIHRGGQPIPYVTKVSLKKKLIPGFIERMKPYSFHIPKQEVPELSTVIYPVRLPPRIKTMYNELKEEGILEFEEGGKVAVMSNVFSLIAKLAQLTSGLVKDEEGVLHSVDTSKIDSVIGLVKMHDEPAVVFCRFVADMDRLVEKLPKSLTVSQIRGSRKDDPRGDWDVMIVQVQSGSESIDLSKSRFVYFVGLPYSYIKWYQAISRVHRRGQGRPVTAYLMLAPNTIDHVIWSIVSDKRNLTLELYDRLDSQGKLR